MPNKASNQLFLLIKSMSKQEKRYFRIFSSRHSNEKNNYYTLYQVLDRQVEYDEDVIIKMLNSHQFVNRLSIAKTRLYDQILKSLSAFHAQKSIDSELFFILQSVEILYSKALYKAAWKKLHSGIKLANKYEKKAILIQLNNWSKKLIEKDNYQSYDCEQIDHWREKEQRLMNDIRVYNSLWYVKSKVFKMLFYGVENSPSDLKYLQDLISENLDPLEEKDLSIKSKFLYHHILSAFCFARKQLSESYDHLKLNLQLLQGHSWLFSENSFSEISILSNMSYIGTKLGLTSEIKPIVERMEKWHKLVDQSDENLKIRWFYSYYSIFLVNKINEDNCTIDTPEISLIEEGLSNFDEKIPILRKSDLKMALSVFYTMAGHHRLALKTVHSLLNELSSKQNAELYFTARFFYLLLLIELNKKDYFEVAWLSTKRLLKNNVFTSSETSALTEAFDKYNKSQSVTILIDQLSIIKNNNRPENPFFSFRKWAINKNLNNRNAMAS
jgi:hypothetical protein